MNSRLNPSLRRVPGGAIAGIGEPLPFRIEVYTPGGRKVWQRGGTSEAEILIPRGGNLTGVLLVRFMPVEGGNTKTALKRVVFN